MHRDVTPSQILAFLEWQGKFTNRFAGLRVQLQHFKARGHKNRIVRGRDIRAIYIHPHAHRAGDFTLPQKRAVVRVICHHHFRSLYEEPTVNGQRTGGARVAAHHVLTARLAVPQHPKRPFHQRVRRG